MQWGRGMLTALHMLLLTAAMAVQPRLVRRRLGIAGQDSLAAQKMGPSQIAERQKLLSIFQGMLPPGYRLFLMKAWDSTLVQIFGNLTCLIML